MTSVGVTVVPSSGRASAATASSWWASSTAAFAPARVEARVRGPAAHLELVERDTLPLRLERAGRARLEHERRLDPRAAVSSISGRAVGEPSSSSVVSRTTTPSSDSSTERAKRSCTTPAFMSKTPGPVAFPSRTSNGQRARVPSGPDRVHVADQQHAGRRAETEAEMRTPAGLEPLDAAPEQLGREARCDVGAGAARALVGRRRLGLDEPAQRVDHLGRARAQVAEELLLLGHLDDDSRRLAPDAMFGGEAKLPPAELVTRDHAANAKRVERSCIMAHTELQSRTERAAGRGARRASSSVRSRRSRSSTNARA